VLSVPSIDGTDRVLTSVLGMRRVREYLSADSRTPATEVSAAQPTRTVHVYAMGEGGAAAEIHLMVEADLPTGGSGAGSVHHVAFRVTTVAEYEAWAKRLQELGLPSSGPVDRYYFRSLYFREPNGILFELATDGPGFAVDEPMETLGERLALPPFLEPRRQEIEAGLKPLIA